MPDISGETPEDFELRRLQEKADKENDPAAKDRLRQMREDIMAQRATRAAPEKPYGVVGALGLRRG